MKIRLFLIALISAIAMGTIAIRAADDDQTALGAKMEKIGGAWRKVKAQIADSSKNEDTLAKLAIVKENLVAGTKEEPELAKSKSGAEKDKFVADFRAKMKEETERVDKIIALVKAGKNAEAAELVGVADQASKDAHKSFKKGKKKS
jgi:prophage DNA circulation protein